jgi:protein SCO1
MTFNRRNNLPFALCLVAAAFASVVPAAVAAAQPMAPSASKAEIRRPAPAEIVQKVGVDQKLDGQVPLDVTFHDESGRAVRLGAYFGRGKPVVLTPVYYECPMLCTMTLNGILKAFRVLDLTIGKDFDVVTVSFDPRETPELAAKKKATYVAQYKKGATASAEAGWHFLTGDEASVRQLMDAVGFRYTFDPGTQQYAHASAIMVMTPEGKISRYFYGLEYSTRDLKWGLVEASQNHIGSLADQVILLCYHYDASTGRYSLAITKSLRLAGVLTMVAIGGYVALSLVRERRRRSAPAAAATAGSHADPRSGAE